MTSVGNGEHRINEIERDLAGHETRLRSLEIHVATFGEQVSSLSREVQHLGDRFDKRFDSLGKRMDDEVKGVRRLLIGMMASAIGGTIAVVLSLGVHT